ncbi:MAG: ABC transporter permease, partial [Bryobacteraceae bacterium]
MPDWRAYVREHLRPLRVSPEREAEITGELAQQLEDAFTEAIAAGATEEGAMARAAAQFSDWGALAREIEAAELCRPEEPRGKLRALFHGAIEDVRFALRLLRTNPAFAAVAIFTLAFGIGANTAIFTIVDSMALRPLPYPQPHRLTAIDTRRPSDPSVGAWTSPLELFDLRARTRSFSAIAGVTPVWSLVLTENGEADRVEALYVSAELFPMLGVRPLLGRSFQPQEDARGAERVVVLGHSFWQRRMGRRRDVVGQSLTLGGTPATIVGVLPAEFEYLGAPLGSAGQEIDIWAPLASNPLTYSSDRSMRLLKVIGRLKDGVSTRQAGDEARALSVSLTAEYPATNRGYEMSVAPLIDQVAGPQRPAWFLLLGSVGFVLLMACVNVSNLLLAKAAVRQKEMAVRVALGASALRLVRQLVTEGLVLAFAGGAMGVLLGYWLLRALLVMSPENVMRRSIGVNGPALLVTAGMVLSCALLASLPGAWRIWRTAIADSLRQSGRGVTTGHRRLRSGLIVAQTALAFVLLVGAGLLIRSFVRLLGVNPGFQAESLITLSVLTPRSAQTPAQRTAIYEALRDRILGVPGVLNVAAVSRLPMSGSQLGSWLTLEGKLPTEEKPEVEYRVATPSFFSTMGMPLLRGRFYDEHDIQRASTVLVINETAAKRYWPNEDPVGKRVKLGGANVEWPWITVIGVVGDIRHFGIELPARPEIYRHYAHNPLTAPVLLVRIRPDGGPAVSSLAATVRAVNGEMPVYNVFRMTDLVSKSLARRRFLMWLLSAFSGAALLLAAVGLYGSVSEWVAQRTREIGLRVALGAAPGAVVRMVLRHGLR